MTYPWATTSTGWQRRKGPAPEDISLALDALSTGRRAMAT